ncbi:Transcriptional regulator NovG [Streptomyces sp. YIM 130001]|uniref:ParB N-terminal domain-containing protein n=1 Tax=Streptomyces sp. YIM 130001 TaxID=2259644 RepID=UPI000E64E272|nr:ParB N-terminal domain-containing protein [Streptomyces sp. YIM 130001]RII06875.1 Transcriptional regulator NovG [Streptomyces sp. YIM 130001]
MESFGDIDTELPAHFTQPVRISTLTAADSPRLDGIDEAHAQRLVEVFPSLPPILVHRPTLRVVDGMHRVRAAALLGLELIDAQFFDDADDDEAFIQSVARNIVHGLPLSTADRRAAADRILATFPAMSDRSIAVYTGLDAKSVADVRRRSAADLPQSNVRLGLDGKAHPLDRSVERRHAAELMSRRPELPLRVVAQETGLSLGTAHDVRQRLLRGEEPVPPPLASPRSSATVNSGAVQQPRRAEASLRPQRGRPQAGPARSALDLMGALASDPSLRNSEAGRDFVRWLHAHFFTDDAWRRRIEAVPPHHSETVANIAMKCADTWRRFAQELGDRKISRDM